MVAFPAQPAVGDQATATVGDFLVGQAVIADSGSSTITPSGVNVATTLAVVFTKTFPSAPKIFVQLLTGPSGAGTVFLWVTGVTTTGFTLNINRSTTTATGVYWFAVLTQ